MPKPFDLLFVFAVGNPTWRQALDVAESISRRYAYLAPLKKAE